MGMGGGLYPGLYAPDDAPEVSVAHDTRAKKEVSPTIAPF